jgi:hypothetical protein
MIEAMENKEHDIFYRMWHSEREFPLAKDELMIIKNCIIVNKNTKCQLV